MKPHLRLRPRELLRFAGEEKAQLELRRKQISKRVGELNALQHPNNFRGWFDRFAEFLPNSKAWTERKHREAARLELHGESQFVAKELQRWERFIGHLQKRMTKAKEAA